MRTECFATSAETPILEKAIHVNDREQRTDDSALRRARVCCSYRHSCAACRRRLAPRPALAAIA
jgi:hypothetical protein